MSTMTSLAFADARVYVGTYGKYNNGSIYGKWLDLADYDNKREFLDACYELHSDEHSPELMFQDYEGIPEGLIGESFIDERFFELREELEEGEEEAFSAYCEYYRIDGLKSFELLNKFRDTYMGEFNSEEDFAYGLYEDTIAGDLPEFCQIYFDHERFARDIFSTDYDFVDGFVFRQY